MDKKGFYSTIALVTLILAGMTFYQLKEPQPTMKKEDLKVVMVTDSGSIDDKSFNQGVWEGLTRFKGDYEDVEINYLQPVDDSKEAFLTTIDNAVLSGADVVVTPGFAFEEAVGEAQEIHKDVKFVFIDGQPLKDGEYKINSNVKSIFFKEQEAAFLTGVATAMTINEGKAGFLGGVEVPAVQKLGWGFVSGIAYANQKLGTNVEVADYVYQGTFDDTQAGQMIASGMYDKGVKTILQAAGLVGVGAMAEAKLRTEAGDNVYVVGCDVDQYDSGLMASGESIILTSAMKKIDEAVYQSLTDIVKNEFKGGTSQTLGVVENGVGLPTNNPNLSANILETIEGVEHLIQTGEIEVPATLAETQAFLAECGMSADSVK